MPVDVQHPDYSSSISRWRDIDNAVKKINLGNYLRELNSSDKSPDNVKRNKDYKNFAVYYNFTGQTLNGLAGEVFSKDPEIDLPDGLDYLKENADGKGNSLNQCARVTVREDIKKGRAGLLVTFPQTNKVVSRDDINKGKVRAAIEPIDAKRIINWRVSNIDGVMKLSLIVISESIETIDDDGFGVKCEQVYRELRLDGGVYVDRKWRKGKDGNWKIIPGSEVIPKDSAGNSWDEMPFCFVGSINNDSNVDDVDLSDLADINISHYRNSADFEDSVWYSGQSQPWMSGLDENLIKIMKDEGVYTGGRFLMPVPEGGEFGYATADPNPVVRQAMLDKIDLAKAIGARFIQPGGVAKTASQSNSETKVAHSILSLISSNVSEAYVKAIGFVGRYMGENTDNVVYKLNQDFLPEGSAAQDIKEMVAGWLTGAVPSDDYVRYMKDVGRFDNKKPTEDYVEELNKNAETI